MFKWNYAINSQRRVLCKEKFFKIKISSTVFSAVRYESHTWMTSSAREFSILFFAHYTVSLCCFGLLSLCMHVHLQPLWFFCFSNFFGSITKIARNSHNRGEVHCAFSSFSKYPRGGKTAFCRRNRKKNYCMNWEKLYRATRSVSYTMHSTRSSAKD